MTRRNDRNHTPATRPTNLQPLEPRTLFSGYNDAPYVTLQDPYSREVIFDRTPRFDWSAYDPDGDRLSHAFYLDDDADPYTRPELYVATGSTSAIQLQYHESLHPGVYWWGAAARDPYDNLAYAEPRRLFIAYSNGDDYPDLGQWDRAPEVILNRTTGNGGTLGLLERPGETDLFSFIPYETGTTRVELNVPSNADGFDGRLRVYDDRGYLLGDDDDHGHGNDEELTLPLVAGRRYYALVTAEHSTFGHYALDLDTPAYNPAPTVTLHSAAGVGHGGTTFDRTPTFRWDADDNRVSSVTHALYISQGNANPFTGYTHRFTLGPTADGTHAFTLPRSYTLAPTGTIRWAVTVTDAAGKTAHSETFTLHTRPEPDDHADRGQWSAATDLTLHAPDTGKLANRTDSDLFAFTAPRAGAYTFTVTPSHNAQGNRFDPRLSVHAKANRPAKKSDDAGRGDRETVTLYARRAGQTLYAAVDAAKANGRAGTYAINVKRAPNDGSTLRQAVPLANTNHQYGITGSLSNAQPAKWYRFRLNAPAQAAVLGSASAAFTLAQDRNANGRIDPGETVARSHDEASRAHLAATDLDAGTYLLRVARAPGVTQTPFAADVVLRADPSFNDTLNSADLLHRGTVAGYLGGRDATDVYRVNLNAPQPLRLTINGLGDAYGVTLLYSPTGDPADASIHTTADNAVAGQRHLTNPRAAIGTYWLIIDRRAARDATYTVTWS